MRINFERRMILTHVDWIKLTVLPIIIAFIILSIIIIQTGNNPLTGFKDIFSYAFGTKHGLLLTVYRGILLIFSTLAFILPQSAGIWNIGAPGQLYFGTLAMFGVSSAFPNLPSIVLIPLMLIAASLAGGGLGGIAGFFKGRWDVNEIVVTLMLNNIAYWLVMYFIMEGGPFADPFGSPDSAPVPAPAKAPLIFDVPFTIFLAIGLGVFLYFLLTKTKVGYEIRTFGQNSAAARYAGMSALKLSFVVMVFGGAIAGIAGYHVFAGVPGVYKITRKFAESGDLSYYGIICGLIVGQNPLAVIPASLFISGMTVGSTTLQRRLGLGYGIDLLFLGVLMILIIAFEFFKRYRVVWTRIRKSRGLDKGVK